jgi:hypothetical protein
MSDPAVPYELTFEKRPGYLYAHVKAETMTGEIALSYLREIMDEAARLEQDQLIIEREVPVMMSSGTLFFATTEFTDMIRGMRVAYVNPYPDLDKDMNFAQTIATNRGADYNVVRNVEAAEKWLLG